MKKAIFMVAVLCIISSCSTFRETHYFKDNLQPVPNYYKVNVRGSTLFSSSRYVSGYYDRGAVQAYFGEIPQPKNGLFPVSNKENIRDCKEKDTINKTPKELVLLLSTNSDAIANSIGNLVKSKTVINSMALIANKDKIEELDEVKAEVSLIDTEIELLVAKADTYLNIDTESADFDENLAKERLKQFIHSELFGETTEPLPDKFSKIYALYLKNYTKNP